MVRGVFAEQAGDRYVGPRRAMLDAGGVLPSPFAGTAVTCEPRPDEVTAVVQPMLREHGLAVVLLDSVLTDDDFIAFGAGLGTAIPEGDPAVQPFVTGGVLLNLVGKHRRTDDVSLQPFAVNSLSLHSEGSGRLAADQPRYIVLMCCHPGDEPTASQTVLVSMADVARRLTAREHEVLGRTRYQHLPEGQPILRGSAFSFRDFLGDVLEWVNDADDDPAEVTEALRSLLAAMYAPGAQGVHWCAGLLVVIDNQRYFHGRTAGPAPSGQPRHLKRLRIR